MVKLKALRSKKKKKDMKSIYLNQAVTKDRIIKTEETF